MRTVKEQIQVHALAEFVYRTESYELNLRFLNIGNVIYTIYLKCQAKTWFTVVCELLDVILQMGTAG